jgi:hypothetical protein
MFSSRKALFQNIGKLGTFWRYQGRNRPDFGPKMLKDLARGFRDGQLSYSFGLMPTVGDLRNIASELRRKRKRASSFSVTVRDQHTKTLEKVHGSVDPVCGRVSINEERVGSRTFGARVKYSVPGAEAYTDFFRKWGEFERRFIGANPAALIWEAIPFSFAIDWLLSIDNVLDALWLDNYPGVSVEYWQSEKRSANRRLSYQICTGLNDNGPFPYGSVQNIESLKKWENAPPHVDTVSHYTRNRRDAPSALSQVKVRGGIKQMYLLSLIALGKR